MIEPAVALEIRVRGTVQGVGFRPTVWRIAQECGITGSVANDPAGVIIAAAGSTDALETFIARIRSDAPPLARIATIDVARTSVPVAGAGFRIADSTPGPAHTNVAPDAATCADCRAEVFDPFTRRYRYPFANCTHCGPRLSIVTGVPYDRANTTMAPFVLCAECAAEYNDPADRRFHAQPIACHRCGPRARLERMDGRAVSFDQHSMLDDVDAVRSLLQKGSIVAIKGLGGFHLACDATNATAVELLRARKLRERKPFALMAQDVAMIRRFATVSADEEALLLCAQAPIVLLAAGGLERLPDAVAPGVATLGFMLPATPLHALIVRRLRGPVVMTSGNLSDEPQIIDDAQARGRLARIADYGLFSNRAIAVRIDDSVVRVMAGETRLLRRARGYAPAPLALPPGFEGAPELLAFGAEMKATFCLIKDGQAIVSQHQGDLEDVSTSDDYERNLALYARTFDHHPVALAVDMHPDYLSAKRGRARAVAEHLPLVEVQHHHAHIASALLENGRPLDAPPVIGIALDGLGYGDDGGLWGGEFLLADYRTYRRLGTLRPVALLGGAQAMREPWRNTYAHLMAQMGWPEFAMNFRELEMFAYLDAKPRSTLDAMLARKLNCPPASSTGRLFDAVAAALGLVRERVAYEGEAALLLESIVDRDALANESDELEYPFGIPLLAGGGLPYIEPLAMWRALLGDLIRRTPPGVIAARFHRGFAQAIVAMVHSVTRGENAAAPAVDTAVLSGGCFQNAILLEEVSRRLRASGFHVLMQARVPSNDGGIALGQAAIGAATVLGRSEGVICV